jgi:hypothetical protein
MQPCSTSRRTGFRRRSRLGDEQQTSILYAGAAMVTSPAAITVAASQRRGLRIYPKRDRSLDRSASGDSRLPESAHLNECDVDAWCCEGENGKMSTKVVTDTTPTGRRRSRPWPKALKREIGRVATPSRLGRAGSRCTRCARTKPAGTARSFAPLASRSRNTGTASIGPR